jgi:AhpD family alkylhydroperoxidase
MADESWFEKRAPKMAEGWWNFYNAVEGESVLDKKTKALIAIAVAVHGRCAHCTESRIKKALSLGIGKEEIAETIMLTGLLSSGTELFWATETYNKYLR